MQNPCENTQRKIRVVPFILALICFTLPFIQISCRGQKVVSLTGIQLVTGTEIEQEDPFTGQTKQQRIHSETLVVVVFICTVAAAGLCFASGLAGRILPGVLGASAFICMLLVKKRFDDQMLKEGQGLLNIEYGFGFIAICALSLVGVGLSVYHQSQCRKKVAGELDQKPPEKVDA